MPGEWTFCWDELMTPDPAGAVIASAPIEARNQGTGIVYPTVTTATGNYTIPQLPVGTYDVYFGDPQCGSAPGLAPQWYSGQLTRATASRHGSRRRSAGVAV